MPKFLSPEFGAKFQQKYPHLWRYPTFFITQLSIGQRMLPCQNQLYPSSRFDTIPSCDGQTHDDSIYRASIASRGKNANTINIASSTAIWGKHKHDDSQTSLVPDIAR